MEREGGFLQSTIPLRKRPESRIKISAISIFRSGPTDSTPPFQLSKISKISVFLHKQTYHRLRGMPFLSTVRFQSNGLGFPIIPHFPSRTLHPPPSQSSALSLHHTLSSRKGFIFFSFLLSRPQYSAPGTPGPSPNKTFSPSQYAIHQANAT